MQKAVGRKKEGNRPAEESVVYCLLPAACCLLFLCASPVSVADIT
jgi:hypothetical protein